MEPWTRGIYSAAQSFAGGGAIEASARSTEEARLFDAANKRAQLEGRMVNNQLAKIKVDAQLAAMAQMSPESRNIVAGGFGTGYSAFQQGQLREQQYGNIASGGALADAGDWGGANAKWAAAQGKPLVLPKMANGVVLENQYLPSGGAVATTPVGDSTVAANNARAAASQARAAASQAKAALDAAKQGQVAPLANSMIAKRGLSPTGKPSNPELVAAQIAKAQAEAKISAAKLRLLETGDASKGFVERAGETALNIAREFAEAAGKQGTNFNGVPQTVIAQQDAAKEAGLRAVAKGNGEAFGVPQPTIEPTAPVAPDVAKAQAMMGATPVAGKGKVAAKIPPGAIAKLRNDPTLAEAFEQKYGVPAKRYLAK